MKMKKNVYILLCSEAATEKHFTTSIRTAYYLYKQQIKTLQNFKQLKFRAFKRFCECRVNLSFYQFADENKFVAELPANIEVSNVFAMRVVREFIK